MTDEFNASAQPGLRPPGETPGPAPTSASHQPATRTWRDVDRPALLVATWFLSGLSPKAPGTVGTAASMVLWAPLVLAGAPAWLVAAVALLVFVVGVWASNGVVRGLGREDPQIVVVDEVAGMGVTLIGASLQGWSLLLGFALFRLFDITKPWPVRVADRRVKGGFGVMLDDVLAGVYALLALLVIERLLWPRLFG